MANMGEDEFEEWFLAGLSAEPIPVHDMLGALGELRLAGMGAQADTWAELLEDSLAERGDGVSTVHVLRSRLSGREGDPTFRQHAEARLNFVFRNDPLRKKFVASAGFSRALPLKECFRRLDTLLNLREGALGLDKTWGIGRVSSVDGFYERVGIDFAKKAGHEMSLAYAAEALQFVDEGHLQARRFVDPEGLRLMAADAPGEVVKMALRSHGSLTAPRLQEILTDGIISPDAWKSFWDAARKALKADPLVIVPAKRSDPIQLLDREVSYDARWFEALAKARTSEDVLTRLEALQESGAAAVVGDAERGIIADRLQFLLAGFGSDLSIRVQVLLAARQWQVSATLLDWGQGMDALLDGDNFAATAAQLPSRRLEQFLSAAVEHDNGRTVDAALRMLPAAIYNVLNVAVDLLLELGRERDVAAVFREELGRRQASVEMVLWLAKHPEKLSVWEFGSTGDLMFHVLPLFERPYAGERLRAANQLGELVQQRKWLESAVDSMSEVQRTSFIRALKAAMGRIPLDTQAMIGRVCVAHPELARLLEGTKEESSAPRGGLTSWRSYRLRQQQLDKLINEDIPKNSRDIGVARSYGDLRENFEYKTAKEQQGILLRRRAEWEQELQQVRGTDFAGSAVSAAGMGTTVTLAYPDSAMHVFHILGEWDQDPGLGIISCSSKMGRALAGCKPGDSAVVPGETGDVTCTVHSVSALPEPIRAWARGHGES